MLIKPFLFLFLTISLLGFINFRCLTFPGGLAWLGCHDEGENGQVKTVEELKTGKGLGSEEAFLKKARGPCFWMHEIPFPEKASRRWGKLSFISVMKAKLLSCKI